MAWFPSVPIIDVHKDNFESLWPSIVLAIRNASFVALDAELSGLGPRKNLMLRSFDDRYQALRDVAKSHSILSLGLSCFKAISHDTVTNASAERALRYQVQTFNITMLCNEDYVVEPVALRFLVEHSFDFNKQYSQGVSYYRGQDKPGDKSPHSPRDILSELILSNAPLVLHNGLIDLAFLYQNLYCDMPPKASQFICDLSEMFKAGVMDTKYVADFEERMVASYLEYMFRKCQRSNARLAHEDKQHIAIEFLSYPKDAPFVENHPCELPKNLMDGPETPPDNVCQQYAAHGHCGIGIKCPKSHNPDTILDEEEFKLVARKKRRNQKKRQRRRKRGSGKQDEEGVPPAKMRCDGDDNGEEEDVPDEEGDGCHGDDTQMGSVNGGVEKMNDDMRTSEMGEDAVGGKNGEMGEEADVMVTNGEQVNGTGDMGKPAKTVDNSTSDGPLNPDSQDRLLLKPQYAGCHRAGIDAFMTGFAMATFISQYGRLPGYGSEAAEQSLDGPGNTNGSFVEHYALIELVNKLYLGGKDVPLQITKSHFAKTSANHREKMNRIERT